MVLEKDGDQLASSCEKRRGRPTTHSKGHEYPAYSKKEEGYLDWSLPLKTHYRRKDRGKNRSYGKIKEDASSYWMTLKERTDIGN